MKLRKDRWTAKQKEFMLLNYKNMKDKDLASLLGRSIKSIRNKRQRLDCEKVSGGRGNYKVVSLSKTISETEQIKENNNENK